MGFLKKRKYTLKDCEKWKTLLAYDGAYENRLIFPIYQDKKFISFQARAINDSHPKYKNFPGFNIKDYFYGVNNWESSKSIVLVEGPFDVWRLEDMAVASFGGHLTQAQKDTLTSLNRKGVEELIIAYEEDKYTYSLKLAQYFSPLMKVKVLRLPFGEDPDSLGKNKIIEIIKETRWFK